MDFTILDSILLGLVQGLTEFLPISSSGHLVIAKQVMSVEDLPLMYDVFFHFATLLAVLTYFYKDIISLFSAGLRFCFTILRGNNPAELYQSDEQVRLAVAIIIGTIPAVIAGLSLKSSIETAFSTPKLAAFFLMITGLILLSTRLTPKPGREMSLFKSIVIGIGQACALLPGISRSGTTITAGMWLGLSPDLAARFSFILAVPAILGATVLEFSSVPFELLGRQAATLLTGGAAAYISGLGAIVLVMRFIAKGRFFWFGIYCLAVSVIAWLFIV